MSSVDLNALPVEFEEVENTKIITNGIVLEAFSNFMDKIKLSLNINLDDILVTFNLKDGKYPKNLVKKASDYQMLETAEDKEEFLVQNYELDPDTLKEVFEYREAQFMKLLEIPVVILKVIIKDGIKNSEPVGLFDEFLDVLSLATRLDKSRLFMSDFNVWLELFFRLFFRQQEKVSKSFFIYQGIEKLISSIPILNFMKRDNINTMKKKLAL